MADIADKWNILYWGSGLSGMSTNINHLQQVYLNKYPKCIGVLSECPSSFVIQHHDKIRTYQFEISSIPTSYFNDPLRDKLLHAADAFVFIIDSQRERFEATLQSLSYLESALALQNKELANIPHVFQYNKRDIPGVMPIEELSRECNRYRAPEYQAIATQGSGVVETLNACMSLIKKINSSSLVTPNYT